MRSQKLTPDALNPAVDRPSLLLAQRLAIAIPALLLGGAYISQYVFGLFPCEMCWWQRYPHFIALILGLVAAFTAPIERGLGRPIIALAAVAIIASGLIGGFHAGVEYDWWEGITGCATNVAAGGSALDNIMNAPLVRCDVAPWQLFGISLAGWNFIVSITAGCAILALLMRRKAG